MSHSPTAASGRCGGGSASTHERQQCASFTTAPPPAGIERCPDHEITSYGPGRLGAAHCIRSGSYRVPSHLSPVLHDGLRAGRMSGERAFSNRAVDSMADVLGSRRTDRLPIKDVSLARSHPAHWLKTVAAMRADRSGSSPDDHAIHTHVSRETSTAIATSSLSSTGHPASGPETCGSRRFGSQCHHHRGDVGARG